MKFSPDAENSVILDVGCGRDKHPGSIGMDMNPRTGADVIHDMNTFPYPFAENTFDTIYAISILEHVVDFIGVMEELYRISKPGARIKINIPYFSSMDSYSDPTHVRTFTSRSFYYFTGQYPEYDYYSIAKFKIVAQDILFFSIPKLGGLRPHNLLGIHWFANRFPSIYERFFAYIFPAQKITIELAVVK